MEVWKDIPGYEGLYQAVKTGKIKSLARFVNNCNGTSFKKERILKGSKDKDGYLRVALCKDGNKSHLRINRLVLITFRGLPTNLNYVSMHLNDIVDDNNLSNLKWGSHSDNTIDALNKGRRKPKSGKDNSMSRPVIKMNYEGVELKEYVSITAAIKDLGNNGNVTTIWGACKGKWNSAFGYKWKFAS